MSRRLLGPIGGPIIFLLVAGLVFAGLGWVTVASLGVERAQQEAAAQAEHLSRMQRAVWRMDGRLLPVFAVEDSRPFHHYASPELVVDYGPASTPLLAAPFTDWMRLHFQVSPDVGWDSPQVLPSDAVATLRQRWPGLPLRNVTPDRINMLGMLRAKYPTAQVIEVFAARERAIPADSGPLGVPFFINEIAPDAAPLPHSSTTNGREAAPGMSDLINTMPPAAVPPPTEGATQPTASAASGTALADDPAANGGVGELMKEPAPAVQLQLAPQGTPLPPPEDNRLRQNSAYSKASPGGEYPLRAQSIGRGMEDAKNANTFPNQNPLYGGSGPLALRNFEKRPAPAMPARSGAAPAFAPPGLPVPAGPGGFVGGFGATPPMTMAAPSGGIPPGTGTYGFAVGGRPASGTPPVANPAGTSSPIDMFENRKEPEGIDGLAKGAADFEPSFDKSLARRSGEAERFRKEKSESPGANKDAARPAAESFFDAPKSRGLFGSVKEALRAKEAENKLTKRGGSFGTAEPGVKAKMLGSTDRAAEQPPLAAAPPAGGVAGTPGAPAVPPLMKPSAEKKRQEPPGAAVRSLAPDALALGRPFSRMDPAPAGPADEARPSAIPDFDADKPAEPIPPTPDPAPPAVLEPAPPEPMAGDSFMPTVAVHLGSMRPQWLTAADGTELLVLVRAARLENKTVYQGVVLDWPKLQTVLKEEVKDLFPEAKLVAVKDPSGVSPERTMTALPVQLDPGPTPEPPPVGWTPLRFGLVLAWTAALIAFAAVALCGWSLIDLSERRIRFVSAVTHELRTPLTALRLYLDLLLSGMVQDEEKRREYLSTLNAESDRLHRLVDNVLDFARLERRRTGTSVQTLKVGELFDQVRCTWTDRCGTDHKELVVVSTLPPDAEIATDPILVQQIIGNLIDNARKYTRDAEDSRIWVWAKPGGRNQIFIEVEDRGSGIPPRERSTIFRPFRRGESADTRAGGAGLGLALSKQWAEVLGGRLTCRPADGGTGSCFRLELRVK
jgi:signal transduction histidine kinase